MGTITGWQVGDFIHFLNTVTSVKENAAHTLLSVTFANTAASYFLADQQANTTFMLQPDSRGGTDLILVPTVGVQPLHEAVLL
jgi:hypothetical protein